MRLACYSSFDDVYPTASITMVAIITILLETIIIIISSGIVYAIDRGEIAQFDFTQNDCHNGIVPEVTGKGIFGDLILNKSVSCLRRTGIMGSRWSEGYPSAFSVKTNAAFIDMMREPDEFPGFTLEVWVTVGDEYCSIITQGSCFYPIFSIGDPIRDETVEECGKKVNFQLDYLPYTRNFQAVTRNDEDECEYVGTHRISVPEELENNCLQLVISTGSLVYKDMTFNTFRWHLNGTLFRQSLAGDKTGGDGFMNAWHDNYTIQFLDRVRWPKSIRFMARRVMIHRARIFPFAIDDATVAELYAEGVANSVPTVYNSSQEIKEDGEFGEHYDTPMLYDDYFPLSELDKINLKFYDSDLDPLTPNFIEILPRFFIDVLPSVGHIIDTTGEVVLEVPYEVPTAGVGSVVRYRPQRDDYSSDVYTNFSFYAEDGVTGEQGFGQGYVTIYVRPINDPPYAGTGITLHAYAAIRRNIVGMWGYDVDVSDSIQGFEVVELTSNGTLYQVYENETISMVKITYSGESIWTGAKLTYVFRTDMLQTNSYEDDIVGFDSFSYRVYDLDGNRSFPASINIIIYTGVFSLSYGRAQCYEDEDCDITLFGTALSDSQENMMYTVVGIPPHGKLFDAASGAIIEPGTLLTRRNRYPYERGVVVVYRPPHDFFNDPDVTWMDIPLNESDTEIVSFYVSIAHAHAVLSSSVLGQSIKVTNVDDSSTITCLENAVYNVRGTTTMEEFNYDRPDRVAIYNISIDEYDKGADPVRVDVDVASGVMSLNALYRDRMDFSLGCSGLGSFWGCRGQSTAEDRMVFIGTPKDVVLSLNGMVYFNQYDSRSTTMVIKIYDGQGGSCLSSRGFSTTSVRPECVESSCTFTMKTGALYGFDEDETPKIVISVEVVKAVFLLAFMSLTVVSIRITLSIVKYLFQLVCPCIKLKKKKDKKEGSGDVAEKGEQPESPAAEGDGGAGRGKSKRPLPYTILACCSSSRGDKNREQPTGADGEEGAKVDQKQRVVTGKQAKGKITKGASQDKPAANAPKDSNSKTANANAPRSKFGRGRASISPPKGSVENPSAHNKDGHRGRHAVHAQGWTD